MFWHHLLFFGHLPDCLGAMTVKLKITTKWTLKMLKLGMVSSFHPHSMCKKLDRVTAKTRCTSCTKWTISSEVSGFRTKTHLLHWLFNILITYCNSGPFLRSDAQFKSTSSTFNPFWHNFLFLMHLLICFELNDPEFEKHYKWTLKMLKLGMVSSFHLHSMCKQVERVTTKTGCTSCTNWTLSKYQGFGRKLICYTGNSKF